MSSPPFLNFLKATRAAFVCSGKAVRLVHVSDITETSSGSSLAGYIADKAPLLYRTLPKVVDSLGDGYFVTTMKETLDRLPTSDSFKESHFGEIATSIFVEEVMGLRKLYSKLSLLTAENANAFKMDLVMYRPGSNPVEFIFGEVKSSPKTAADGLPAKHNQSCFADIFRSFNKYGEDDLRFDLTAAKDNITVLDPSERDAVRKALKPYAERVVTYAGFAIIDQSTKCDDEVSLLATRKNRKPFNIDLICIEGFPTVADAVYKKLEVLRNACSSLTS